MTRLQLYDAKVIVVQHKGEQSYDHKVYSCTSKTLEVVQQYSLLNIVATPTNLCSHTRQPMSSYPRAYILEPLTPHKNLTRKVFINFHHYS